MLDASRSRLRRSQNLFNIAILHEFADPKLTMSSSSSKLVGQRRHGVAEEAPAEGAEEEHEEGVVGRRARWRGRAHEQFEVGV